MAGNPVAGMNEPVCNNFALPVAQFGHTEMAPDAEVGHMAIRAIPHITSGACFMLEHPVLGVICRLNGFHIRVAESTVFIIELSLMALKTKGHSGRHDFPYGCGGVHRFMTFLALQSFSQMKHMREADVPELGGIGDRVLRIDVANRTVFFRLTFVVAIHAKRLWR